MEWETLRHSLDLALRHGQRKVTVVITGGEPLLEFDLIRKAVAYANRASPGRKRVSFKLVTNGTLLTEDKVTFAAKHSISTQLSFDGVRPVQDLRGRGTFASLDKLLGRLQEQHPDFYKKHLTIGATVVPLTVRHMADSVEYFLENDARKIIMSSSLLAHSDWRSSRVSQFEKQFARIYDMSLSHFDRTGRIPFLLFQPTKDEKRDFKKKRLHGRAPVDSRRRADNRTSSAVPSTKSGSVTPLIRRGRTQRERLCAAGRGEMLSVDVDGRVYACVMLARSYQRFTTPVLEKSAEAMSLGNLAGPQFLKRYHDLPKTALQLGIFAPREKGYSSYRRCRDCPYCAQCFICPVSAGHLRRNDSCERVPDFSCAFNFTAFKYRGRFLEKILWSKNRAGALTC
jgi:MoaA/NifB/PqqE/SkfB family radical SAM enzyme